MALFKVLTDEQVKELETPVLYSKIKSKNTIIKVCHCYSTPWDATLDVCKKGDVFDPATALYKVYPSLIMIDDKGVIRYKHNNKWGFKSKSIISQELRGTYAPFIPTPDEAMESNLWIENKTKMSEHLREVCPKWLLNKSEYDNDNRDSFDVMLRIFMWMNYPDLDLKFHQTIKKSRYNTIRIVSVKDLAVLMMRIYGFKKKPPAGSIGSYRDMHAQMISRIKSRKLRKHMAKRILAIPEERLREAGSLGIYEDARNNKVLEIFLNTTNQKVVDVIIDFQSYQDCETYPLSFLYPQNLWSIQKFFEIWPEAIYTSANAYSHHAFRDIMRMYKKMNKVEKAEVHGRSVQAIHDSVTEVYNRYTYARVNAVEIARMAAMDEERAKKEEERLAKLKDWQYSDEFKAIESHGVRLVHITKIPKLGVMAHNCVGGYTNSVVDGNIAICKVASATITCIEVGKPYRRAGEPVSNTLVLRQAKLDHNAPIRSDKKMYNVVKRWCDEHNIDYSNCYDMTHSDSIGF